MGLALSIFEDTNATGNLRHLESQLPNYVVLLDRALDDVDIP